MSNHFRDATKMGKPETYMTIHADGRITVSDKLKPDETAARVLECMKTQFLGDAQATKIRELQDRIKRMEEALDKIEEVMKRPASNHRLMQIAGPARQVINIVKQAKEDKLCRYCLRSDCECSDSDVMPDIGDK